MSKLKTYRVSYRVTEGYHVEVKASSPKQAAEWVHTMLEEGPLAVHGSQCVRSEHSITDTVETAGVP